MGPRTRKFIGLLGLLAFLALYIAAAIILAPAIVPQNAKLFEALYYAVAGFLWAIPAGLIIAWMQAPPKPKP